MRRIALYSHDAQGLGHMRRNIAIAAMLARAEPSAVLLLAGAREAGLFTLPRGTDLVCLPALKKASGGGYRSRSLGLELDAMVGLRSEILRSALAGFRPDVLVVDKLPTGVEDELAPSFDVLEEMGTRVVLGLREVLDDPDQVAADWRRQRFADVVRDHYDAIWVYGDRRVYDPALEYRMPADIAARVRYSGYLDRRRGDRGTPAQRAAQRAELGLPDKPLNVCLVGGGEDGFALADAFARAEIPAGTHGVVVTGPFMPAMQRATIQRLAADRDDLRVLDFVEDADTLIALADRVVSMGGYNTSCEVVACGKRALIVPRVRPRREQLIRTQRLAALGAVDLLPPELLSPGAISQWLTRAPAEPDPLPVPIDLGGLERLPSMLDEVLTQPGPARRPSYVALGA